MVPPNPVQHIGIIDFSVYQEYRQSGFRDGRLFRQFAENAMDAMIKSGTALITHAPILVARDRLLDIAKTFFHLDDATKERFEVPGNDNQGYVRMGRKKPEDRKAYYHVDTNVAQILSGKGMIHAPGDAVDLVALQGQVLIENYVPGFTGAVLDFTEKSKMMGEALTEVLAYHFDLDVSHAYDMKNGNSVLRLLHYPPFDAKGIEGATWAQAHADISAFTFLPPPDQPGLQIVPKDAVFDTFGTTFVPKKSLEESLAGHFLDVPLEIGACVVNIGRTAEILSNGVLPATIHRVIPSPEQQGIERFSMPFFYHFAWDKPMKVWSKAVEMRHNVNYFNRPGADIPTIAQYVMDKENGSYRRAIEPVVPVPVYRPQ